MIDTSKDDSRSLSHFFAIVAIQMRRPPVEHAAAHRARKRGGGAPHVTSDDLAAVVSAKGTLDFVALNEALEKLAQNNPDQCRLVELRYFGGLFLKETAHLPGVSEVTVKGDWRVAKAWLLRELSDHPSQH